jgi:hypothetical protein
VGLVADDEIPSAVRCLKFLLHILIARQLVEAGDDEVGFQKPVAGPCGLKLVVRRLGAVLLGD